ncbi:hypothetical protein F4678DRAFT_333354 [Xylaria arbuscula]|nr:hypothetical protein F4678DRAFT_333354 [Xylaria arbuscula]
MADPLSIAASVAGLIALSGGICKLIRAFIRHVTNPPQYAQILLLSVMEMRMVLESVSDMIDNLSKFLPIRRAIVRLNHLIICLTKTSFSFSELQKLIDLLIMKRQKPFWQRLQLAMKNERITRINNELHENKISINLVLTILQ